MILTPNFTALCTATAICHGAGGKVRLEFAITADHGPALRYCDSAGKNRLVLGVYSPANYTADGMKSDVFGDHAVTLRSFRRVSLRPAALGLGDTMAGLIVPGK